MLKIKTILMVHMNTKKEGEIGEGLNKTFGSQVLILQNTTATDFPLFHRTQHIQGDLLPGMTLHIVFNTGLVSACVDASKGDGRKIVTNSETLARKNKKQCKGTV